MKLDFGKFLAGDKGGKFEVSRKFGNGWKIGGYFTLTDAPFSDLGNRRGIVFDKPSIDPKEDGPTCDSISLKSFGHSGWTGTIAWADPKEEIVYVFLSNGRAYPDGNNMSLVKENVRTDIQKIIYNSIVN